MRRTTKLRTLLFTVFALTFTAVSAARADTVSYSTSFVIDPLAQASAPPPTVQVIAFNPALGSLSSVQLSLTDMDDGASVFLSGSANGSSTVTYTNVGVTQLVTLTGPDGTVLQDLYAQEPATGSTPVPAGPFYLSFGSFTYTSSGGTVPRSDWSVYEGTLELTFGLAYGTVGETGSADINPSQAGSGVQLDFSSGEIGGDATITYGYTPSASAPEPGSALLFLLGAGIFIASKAVSPFANGRRKSVKTFSIIGFILLTAPLLTAVRSYAATIPPATGYTYTNIAPPGSSDSSANGINNNGVIVGWQLSGTLYTGFIDNHGSFTTVSDGLSNVVFNAINNAGTIVGQDNSSGLIYSGGIFTDYNAPNSLQTVLTGINDNNVISGYYQAGNNNFYGFTKNGSTVSLINIPGALSTFANGINNAGEVVGYYENASFSYVSFLDNGGTFTYLSVPGGAGTFAQGINNEGQIVGYYETSTSNYLGFLYAGGQYFTIFPPFAAPGDESEAYAINDASAIVGYYGLLSDPGFLATLNTGAAPEPATAGLMIGAGFLFVMAGVVRRKRLRFF